MEKLYHLNLINEITMQFNSVEDAYFALANYIQAFIGMRKWSEAGCKIGVFEKMAKGSQWLNNENIKDEQGGFETNQNALWDGLDAALFLRDNLLATTGQRIWGLTFTLYPDGKFNIEYDYNKPEDYQETDEAITGEEINQSLTNLSN